MSFDEQINTYIMVVTQRNYQTYLPYIIYYLSPYYVEQTFSFNLIKKKVISPEQLIGVSCGSASVFFLVLGIVICFIKKKYENKVQFDEFDDISCSSSEIEFNQRFNETQILNINENQETEEDISIKEINEAIL